MAILAPPSPLLTPTKTARAAPIEGLRALAALWVVCSHIWISQMGLVPRIGALGLATNWLLYSHLAIDVFIVLSGYCLSLAVVRDGGLRDGARGFWRRRARRILPPLYGALGLALAVTFVLQRMDNVPVGVGWPVLGVNLLLVQDLFLRANALDSPLWSVAVEWRLSLLFPVLVWVWRRGGTALMLAVAAAGGYALAVLILRDRPSLLMACPWYAALFALGFAVACAAQRREPVPAWAQRAVGIGALLALLWLLRAYPVAAGGVAFGRHMPMIDAAVGVLAALLLLRLRCNSAAPSAALSWGPLAALGQFSYSLYLTHDPLLRLLERVARLVPLWGALPALARAGALAALGLPLLVAGAYGFYILCERPFVSARPAVWKARMPGIFLAYVPKATSITQENLP